MLEPSAHELAGIALGLGARKLGVLSAGEQSLSACAPRVATTTLRSYRDAIARGEDPLGDALCRLRSPLERRPLGATYTPHRIVRAMTTWARAHTPSRVVDPGAGSGRFLVAAGRQFPNAALIATEVDALSALLLRAHLYAAGLAPRASVVVGDYRSLTLPNGLGPTLFLGNPPYVRHHALGVAWKAWLVREAAAFGLAASQLAGLHVHFFLATARLARPGDYGALVTAAEWLDVNYGSLVRRLLLERLGVTSLHLLEPSVRAFADAHTTSVITCFEVGSRRANVRLRRVASLAALGGLQSGRLVPRAELANAPRWTPLTVLRRKAPADYVELGELCRVHRGQVTGNNAVWIAGPHGADLPDSVLFPAVTKARELFAAGDALACVSHLKRVIDLPSELEALPSPLRARIERFLRVARGMGAARGFIAEHRRAWWSVGLRAPAPILATYMARRPPAFVRNLAGARHINVAHGLYPREPLTEHALAALARHLSSATSVTDGRTYAGGLTKFEPREMERLLVPAPQQLEAH